ncbi:glycosyltransferase family 4 protein [Microbacterium sp. P5_E9]
MTQPLRILHAISSDRFAGVEQFVRRLAIRQAQDGHLVAVFGGAEEHMADSLSDAGVQWGPADSTLAVLNAVRRHLSTSDLINSHMTAADVAAVAARATSRHKVSIIATRHFAQQRGTLGPGILYRVLERHIDAEIAVSRTVADRIGVPSTVIHPGIEPGSLRDPSTRRPTVLVAQRLQAEKHTDLAIRAFAASGIWERGWDLQVAGTGPDHDFLLSLARELHVDGHVRFLGFRGDLENLMGEAGMLFASSPFEHFGLTVLEAMAAGLPVVAAAAAGHVEMLHGFDDRALFAPHDVQGAAERLRSLAADSPGRAALGRAERARQVAEFSLRSQADATASVYRRAIEMRGRGR